jgi:alkyl hydroperoxide reductase subunit AhpC
MSSKDFAGKWHVLYWYPLDFTFVCPMEISGFQENLREFGDDKIDVIGVSTDSFFSHKAWFSDRKTFPQEITHPVRAAVSAARTKKPHLYFRAYLTALLILAAAPAEAQT